MARASGSKQAVDFDRIGRKTPLLVDLKPSGQNYMEDWYKVKDSYLIDHHALILA